MVENLKNDVCILLLVKYPEKGKVKVRLARRIGDDFVVELYRNFVLDSLSTLKRSGISFVICFYPADTLEKFKTWLGAHYEYIPQRGKDLGERLKNGFVDVFSRGFMSAMAIGSDSPDLPEDILEEAQEALEMHDVVIGPSPDGGYYLIGFKLNKFLPEAFDGITWSTEVVFRETIERLKEVGRDVFILPPWNDVDEFDDLKGLGKRNSNFCSSETMKDLLQHREILNGGER